LADVKDFFHEKEYKTLNSSLYQGNKYHSVKKYISSNVVILKEMMKTFKEGKVKDLAKVRFFNECFK
jgi:hypothetical protein